MPADFSQIGPFLIAAVVLFAVYRRFRRNFGQQRLRPVRMRIRIIMLLIVGGILLPLVPRSTPFVAAVVVGSAFGLALASWGAARTRFLKIQNQLYYVPHTYTGVAVSSLFLGRLVYRLVQGNAPAGMLRSPLTFALFFVLVGYYVYYYSAVLWKSKRVIPDEVSQSTLDPVS